MLRIDKYLWSVRIFKTRTEAADACKHGKVAVGEHTVKPSYDAKIGDIIVVRKSPVHYQYKVIAMPASRVGAKLVANFVEDITPQEELDKLNANNIVVFAERDRGAGRPTKRDRRKMEEVCQS
jgi:ribosome-associated heat shock protein Hsp15